MEKVKEEVEEEVRVVQFHLSLLLSLLLLLLPPPH